MQGQVTLLCAICRTEHPELCLERSLVPGMRLMSVGKRMPCSGKNRPPADGQGSERWASPSDTWWEIRLAKSQSDTHEDSSKGPGERSGGSRFSAAA